MTQTPKNNLPRPSGVVPYTMPMDLLSGDYGSLFTTIPSNSASQRPLPARAKRAEQESPLLDLPDDDSIFSHRSRRSSKDGDVELSNHTVTGSMGESVSGLASDEECSHVRVLSSSTMGGSSMFASDSDDDESNQHSGGPRAEAGGSTSSRRPPHYDGECSKA